MNQQSFVGISSIEKFFFLLREYNPHHIFLVRGKKSYDICGAKNIINRLLAILHCDITEFYDFEENPKIEDLEKGLSLLRQNPSSIIIGIGGGSVLDMSKLLRFFYSYSGDMTGQEFKKECNLLPLIVLPTTAGTGSEATHFSVLYKDNVKYSIEHEDILPDVAIVYPPFTYNNPQYLTACTGFDALAQGIEAYWNVNATEESDKYAKRAIELLWSNLPIAVNSPTNEVRNKISEGSYWAGCAINVTKTTAPHAFSYPLTTNYGYPHGHAVALTFPFFFNLNLNLNRLKSGIDIELYKSKIEYLRGICTIPIKDYINHLLFLSPREADYLDIQLIVRSVNIQRLNNNPVNIDSSVSLDQLI